MDRHKNAGNRSLKQLLLLTLLFNMASAALPMPPGWNGVWDRNKFVWCRVAVDGVPDSATSQARVDSVISGTNVNVTLSAMTNPQTMVGNEIPNPPAYTGANWTSFKITKAELEIGPETFLLSIAPDPPRADTRNLVYGGHVRFASNHFSHNQVILVRMRVNVELKNATETKTVVSPWAEWTCRVYNRALTWATAEEYLAPGGYTVWPDGPYASEAKKGALYAEGSVFSGPLLHDLLLGTKDVQERYRSPILGALGTSTLTLPFTHGEAVPPQLRASKPNGDDAYLTYQDILAATNRPQGSGVPLPNMAILYICSGASGNAFMNAFRVNGLPGSNRAGIGFGYPVWSELLIGPAGKTGLSDQCKALLDLLKAGWTAKAATTEVDTIYQARYKDGTFWKHNKLVCYGDENACIAGVYTEAEKKGDTTWYLVKSSVLLSDTE